jgi:hypothetical protein
MIDHRAYSACYHFSLPMSSLVYFIPISAPSFMIHRIGSVAGIRCRSNREFSVHNSGAERPLTMLCDYYLMRSGISGFPSYS